MLLYHSDKPDQNINSIMETFEQLYCPQAAQYLEMLYGGKTWYSKDMDEKYLDARAVQRQYKWRKNWCDEFIDESN
jgi:hypothetical protein